MNYISTLTMRERILIDIKIDNDTGCWEWQRGTLKCGGYGQFRWEGKMRRAHVESYKEFKGPVGDLCVLHKCDNPLCCNPDHLFLGTRIDNARDRDKKRRLTPRRMFTPEQVQEFRRRRWEDGEKCADLAREAGVDPSTMSRVTSKTITNRYGSYYGSL